MLRYAYPTNSSLSIQALLLAAELRVRSDGVHPGVWVARRALQLCLLPRLLLYHHRLRVPGVGALGVAPGRVASEEGVPRPCRQWGRPSMWRYVLYSFLNEELVPHTLIVISCDCIGRMSAHRTPARAVQ